jgi:Cd2+/Zn2+-exporting ATPase
MGVRDQIRPGVKQDLRRLKKLGVKNLMMLSGDNQGTVDAVSRELGLDPSPWQHAAGGQIGLYQEG